MSTESEVDAHMTRHAVYRGWCPDCIHGRGLSHQHRGAKVETLGREFISDYAAMTSEKTMCPVLVRYNYGSEELRPLAVDKKVATAPSTKWGALGSTMQGAHAPP